MLENKIFSIDRPETFRELALKVFVFQYENNPVYRSYCDYLSKEPSAVNSLEEIPFLPIELFKTHHVKSGSLPDEVIFSSSGTTSQGTSMHHVARLSLYEQSFLKGFASFYGQPSNWAILALLPSYLEREGSSLIYMADRLIADSKYEESGFFLNDLDRLATVLKSLEEKKAKILLLGVSFALLDLLERHSFDLKHTVVMETGGMKGRRKEMIRDELHQILKTGFGVTEIHSEYGMTELLSQAYSTGGGRFNCPPWMRIFTRDTEDPFTLVQQTTGGVNVIDLANLYSCSFLATQDLGKVFPDGSFEILGRFDHSDVRGCNLMVL